MFSLAIPSLTLPQRKRRAGSFAPGPLLIPIMPSSWTSDEATSDADTRKVYVRLNIAEQTNYDLGAFRGSNPDGNLTQIAVMTRRTSYYDWTSTGLVGLGQPNHTRLARRLKVGPGAWEWITGPADTKPWTASNVPSTPQGTWAALASTTARVTLLPWIGNGRNVTAASYSVNGGAAVAFTPAAAGLETVVDVAGLTDGVSVPVAFTWTNVNGTSTALVLNVIAQGTEPAPLAPEINYTINGTGTEATVYLAPPEEFTGSAIQSVRYQIGAGSQVVVSGAGPIALTGLAASQTLTVEWSNATTYSTPVVIDLIASPTTYVNANWSVADDSTPAGDGLLVTIGTPITVPVGLSLIGTQYDLAASGVWNTLPADGKIATGVPEVLASVRLRPVYNIGPAVPGNAETDTPTYEPVITDYPLQTIALTSSGSGNITSLAMTVPTHAVGNLLLCPFTVDASTLPTVTILEAGWALVRVSTAANDLSGNLYYASKVAASSAETLTIQVSGSGENIIGFVTVQDGAREMRVSAIDENSTSTPRSMDCPGLTFAASEKANGIAVFAQRGESAAPTGAPSGWGTLVSQATASSSAGVRIGYSVLAAEGVTLDPPAWVGNAGNITTVLFAFLPAAGVPPVTNLVTTVSSTTVENGQTVTFTAEADGRAPITYDLVIEGVTYSQTVATNSPITFNVTPTTGSRPWTMTATNASGSNGDSGTITVLENLVYTINSANPFRVVVEADSVSHSVVAATYEVEWQTAAGGTATNVVQASPDFTINFPASDAYRFRVRAINASAVAGAWSDYKYYFAFLQGGITWTGENAQSVAVSPLSTQAPIVVVPVAGRAVRVNAPLPLVAYETRGSSVHTLNGVMYNPDAGIGRGPGAWDSRTGDRDNIGSIHPGFSAALLHTTWPQVCAVGDTFSKARSRPSNAIETTGNGQGLRHGLLDQHSGLEVLAAQPTATQAAPAIIKDPAWSASPIDLPGMSSLVAAFVASSLSTSGMTVPDPATIESRLCRFDPSMKLFRGGTYMKDDADAYRPFQTGPTGLSNYYGCRTESDAVCLAMSGAASSDFKSNVISHLVLRGVQQDFPGNDFRCGAGVSMDNTIAVMLSRIARGLPFDDLATSQREVIPFMYDIWDATTVTYLSPHDDVTKPVFARWKTPLSIVTTGTGYTMTMPFNINTRTGEQKQSFTGLEIFRESTGERLPWGGGTGRGYKGPTEDYITAGFFATPPTTSERFCLQIPVSAVGAFAVGEPYWMYDSESDESYRWQSFNPSPEMAYRDIPDPAPHLMAGHLLGVYPTGVHWQAAKKYRLRGLENWPTATFNYPNNGTTFTRSMFATHAATLGITL